MPAFGRVTEVSPSKPYLGIIVEFDTGIMREVLKMLPPQTTCKIHRGVFVMDFDGPMADWVWGLRLRIASGDYPTGRSVYSRTDGPCGGKLIEGIAENRSQPPGSDRTSPAWANTRPPGWVIWTATGVPSARYSLRT